MKKERKYRRISYPERREIERLYNAGCSYRTIAHRLGRSVSSIHYEVKRGLYTRLNGDTWEEYQAYSADIAEDDALYQMSSRGTDIKLGKNYAYANLVAERIKSGESPDSIVGDLRNRNEWTVSTPTLYRYIDKGYIPGITNKNLIVKRKKKQKYQKVRTLRRPPRGLSIEHRPSEIKYRSTFGHWEMDSVIGSKSGEHESCIVMTERKTRYEIIWKVPAKTASSTTAALQNIVKRYPPNTFKTITVDNGSEFSDYETMKQLTNEIYYCHPYCSSERGSNENANRLIRRFFPKGKSMRHRTQADCDAAAHFINHMHRKILGYRTAAELFAEELAKLTL